jgi:hypothetical protein
MTANVLYAMITHGHTISNSDYYRKLGTPVFMSEKAEKLQNILISGVTDANLALFASVLCYMSQFTAFGAEILEKDPNNTYFEPQRANLSANCAFSGLSHPISLYEKAVRYLDADIKALLDAPDFFDITAAICLQLLREVS